MTITQLKLHNIVVDLNLIDKELSTVLDKVNVPVKRMDKFLKLRDRLAECAKQLNQIKEATL